MQKSFHLALNDYHYLVSACRNGVSDIVLFMKSRSWEFSLNCLLDIFLHINKLASESRTSILSYVNILRVKLICLWQSFRRRSALGDLAGTYYNTYGVLMNFCLCRNRSSDTLEIKALVHSLHAFNQFDTTVASTLFHNQSDSYASAPIFPTWDGILPHPQAILSKVILTLRNGSEAWSCFVLPYGHESSDQYNPCYNFNIQNQCQK